MTTITEPTTHTLDVPGAVLTYDVRKADSPAPVLLLIGSPMGGGGIPRSRLTMTSKPPSMLLHERQLKPSPCGKARMKRDGHSSTNDSTISRPHVDHRVELDPVRPPVVGRIEVGAPQVVLA